MSWLRVYFQGTDPVFVCESDLAQAIKASMGNSVRRTLVAKRDDGTCVGFAWVCFDGDDARHAKGKKFQLGGMTCVFEGDSRGSSEI